MTNQQRRSTRQMISPSTSQGKDSGRIRRGYDDPLLDAIDRESLDSCIEALKDYSTKVPKDKDKRVPDRWTPLTLAAKKGNLDIIKLLLNHGFSLSDTDRKLQTVVHIAVEEGKIAFCSELLKSFAIEINMKDLHGNTPFHLVARQGSIEVFQLLLKKNAEILDITNYRKFTALHFAAQEGNFQIVRQLLDNGADREIRNKLKRIPLHYAAERGCTESCAYLLEKVPDKQLKFLEHNNHTPLMLAAMQGHHRCCRLMKMENTINLWNNHRDTALHCAFRREYFKTAEVLFSLGADANIYNEKGYTPLLEAASNKTPDCIRLAVEGGGDLKLKNKKDQNALHLAACEGSELTLSYLLELEVMQEMVNDQDEEGLTPLHHAIKTGNTGCCILLCQKGASGYPRDIKDATPLHFAADTSNANACKEILNEKKILVSPADSDKNTPLHLAAKRGSVECCRLLLGKHAMVSAKNSRGQIPIHMAAEKGHEDCVKLLARNTGTVRKATDMDDRTALHVAAASGALGCCRVLLRRYQPLLWTPAKTDTLPLDLAFGGKHDELFRFLLQNMIWKKTEEGEIGKIQMALEGHLHIYLEEAIHENRIIVIQALLESSWWKYAVTHQGVPTKNFIHLVERYPEYALTVLDTCNTKDEKDVGISLLTNAQSAPPWTYQVCLTGKQRGSKCHDAESGNPSRCIRSCYASDLEWFKEHPVAKMVANRRLDLLKHPLTEAWLLNRWLRFAVGFYLYLAYELLFSLLLSVLAGLTSNWMNSSIGKEIICGFPTSCNISDSECTKTVEQSVISNCTKKDAPHESTKGMDAKTVLCSDVVPGWSAGVISVSVCLAGVLAVTIILEINFLMRFGRWYWHWWCLPKLVRILAVLLFIVPWTSCCLQTGMREDFQWIFGIVSVLLGWIIFGKTLARLPTLSFIMPITREFMKSYVKLVVCIIVIILLFASTFHLLLWNQKPFKNVPQAVVKTIVLMLGDYGYDDMFLGDEPVAYPIITNIFFIIFIITIGSFIVNLIITKPNDLMENFRRRAKEERVSSRAQWVMKLEMYIPKFLAVDFPDDGSSKSWLGKLSRFLWLQDDQNQKERKSFSERPDDYMQSLQTLCDVVNELKTQVNDLKKEVSAMRGAPSRPSTP